VGILTILWTSQVGAEDLNQQYREYLRKLTPSYYDNLARRDVRREKLRDSRRCYGYYSHAEEYKTFCRDYGTADMLRLGKCMETGKIIRDTLALPNLTCTPVTDISIREITNQAVIMYRLAKASYGDHPFYGDFVLEMLPVALETGSRDLLGDVISDVIHTSIRRAKNGVQEHPADVALFKNGKAKDDVSDTPQSDRFAAQAAIKKLWDFCGMAFEDNSCRGELYHSLKQNDLIDLLARSLRPAAEEILKTYTPAPAVDLNQQYREYLRSLPKEYYQKRAREFEDFVDKTSFGFKVCQDYYTYREEYSTYCRDFEEADEKRLSRCMDMAGVMYAGLTASAGACKPALDRTITEMSADIFSMYILGKLKFPDGKAFGPLVREALLHARRVDMEYIAEDLQQEDRRKLARLMYRSIGPGRPGAAKEETANKKASTKKGAWPSDLSGESVFGEMWDYCGKHLTDQPDCRQVLYYNLKKRGYTHLLDERDQDLGETITANWKPTAPPDLNQQYRAYLEKLPQGYYDTKAASLAAADAENARICGSYFAYHDEYITYCRDYEKADMLRLSKCMHAAGIMWVTLFGDPEACTPKLGDTAADIKRELKEIYTVAYNTFERKLRYVALLGEYRSLARRFADEELLKKLIREETALWIQHARDNVAVSLKDEDLARKGSATADTPQAVGATGKARATEGLTALWLYCQQIDRLYPDCRQELYYTLTKEESQTLLDEQVQLKGAALIKDWKPEAERAKPEPEPPKEVVALAPQKEKAPAKHKKKQAPGNVNNTLMPVSFGHPYRPMFILLGLLVVLIVGISLEKRTRS